MTKIVTEECDLISKEEELAELILNQLNEQEIVVITEEGDLMSKEFEIYRERKRSKSDIVETFQTFSIFTATESLWLI
jgi:hypothetical protein